VTDPSLAQRVEWTHGFRCATDKAVLKAMARWFAWRADGTNVRFTVAELARKAGVPKRSTERALERLEADWRIEVTARRRGSRRPTTYRIVGERLASADPDALQAVDNRQSGGCQRPTTATVADEVADEPPWRMKNAPDFDKVADQRSAAEVRTDTCTRTPSSEEVRQSGGRSGGRPEHPDVPAFLAWARATYPQHTHGAHLVLDRDRDGHLVHGLLEHYPLARLQAMTVLCWTIEGDGDPQSHASWIAKGDRSLRVLKHKAAFLERVVVGAQQLGFVFSARELEEAQALRSRAWGGRCGHDPTCESPRQCVRTIALKRRLA
jgi:hypothetical protein